MLSRQGFGTTCHTHGGGPRRSHCDVRRTIRWRGTDLHQQNSFSSSRRPGTRPRRTMARWEIQAHPGTRRQCLGTITWAQHEQQQTTQQPLKKTGIFAADGRIGGHDGSTLQKRPSSAPPLRSPLLIDNEAVWTRARGGTRLGHFKRFQILRGLEARRVRWLPRGRIVSGDDFDRLHCVFSLPLQQQKGMERRRGIGMRRCLGNLLSRPTYLVGRSRLFSPPHQQAAHP